LRGIVTEPRDPAPPTSKAIAQQLGKLVALVLIVVAVVLIERYCTTEHVRFSPREGNVVYMDGDTLKVDETEVRLFGIDAPELHQMCTKPDGKEWACGRAAQARLKALVARRVIDCEPRGKDRFRRTVSICSTSGVPDLGGALVRDGFAIALPNSSGAYINAEDEARAAKRGIWDGDFERPSDWRLQNRREGN
jgi:endonuclease YncB( thermonuclease family)